MKTKTLQDGLTPWTRAGSRGIVIQLSEIAGTLGLTQAGSKRTVVRGGATGRGPPNRRSVGRSGMPCIRMGFLGVRTPPPACRLGHGRSRSVMDCLKMWPRVSTSMAGGRWCSRPRRPPRARAGNRSRRVPYKVRADLARHLGQLKVLHIARNDECGPVGPSRLPPAARPRNRSGPRPAPESRFMGRACEPGNPPADHSCAALGAAPARS